jgi:hypothetical protein
LTAATAARLGLGLGGDRDDLLALKRTCPRRARLVVRLDLDQAEDGDGGHVLWVITRTTPGILRRARVDRQNAGMVVRPAPS